MMSSFITLKSYAYWYEFVLLCVQAYPLPIFLLDTYSFYFKSFLSIIDFSFLSLSVIF